MPSHTVKTKHNKKISAADHKRNCRPPQYGHLYFYLHTQLKNKVEENNKFIKGFCGNVYYLGYLLMCSKISVYFIFYLFVQRTQHGNKCLGLRYNTNNPRTGFSLLDGQQLTLALLPKLASSENFVNVHQVHCMMDSSSGNNQAFILLHLILLLILKTKHSNFQTTGIK